MESDADVATLEALGCDQVQGFHVSRPLDADALEDWLAEWSVRSGDDAATLTCPPLAGAPDPDLR